MGYSKENLSKVSKLYADKYKRAELDAEKRRAELYEALPDLKRIDSTIRQLGLDGVKAAITGGDKASETIEMIKGQSLELQELRGQILVSAGYPADYTSPRYECEKCGDTGYVGIKMCDCMKRALRIASYESSGIANLMRTQTFDSFSLDYYRDSPDIYETMRYNYESLREYAESFSPERSDSVMLLGGTGLGKTHLSTAVAKTVIDKGFDVLYVGAVNMIADFEMERFGNGYSETDVGGIGRYYNCELLIIDDVGTEVSNQFTVSTLYNVINTRLIKRLPTLISTNLTHEEFRKRYWDRITSRILGEYRTYAFVGKDVRRQKLN